MDVLNVIFDQVNVHAEIILVVELVIDVLQVITIIHVVLDAIVILLVHLNPYAIHIQVPVYVKKMFTDHDVIDVLMVLLLYHLIILRVVPIAIVLVRPHNASQVYLIIVLFEICPIGHLLDRMFVSIDVTHVYPCL